MKIRVQQVASFLGFSAMALALIGAASAVWGILVFANIKNSPSIPWALPALIAFLWMMWQYLGGKGWPKSTSDRRKNLLRANPVSKRAFMWSAVAGLLAIGALAGFWIVSFRLFPMHANPLLPSAFTSSPFMMGAIILGASLLAPITEESAVRGYLQSSLERSFRPFTAVVLSSLVFAIAHLSQGLAAPKLAFYFLVGVTFGALAYFNDSILPVIPVHIAGDLIFFLFIWPFDRTRTLVWQSGADTWFWLHVAQTIVFAVLSVAAFHKLRRVSVNQRAEVRRASKSVSSKIDAQPGSDSASDMLMLGNNL
jgi:membrane protease YdiL (CAAX protease family)